MKALNETKGLGMKYILDFDSTLFNTDLFREKVKTDGREGMLMTPKIWNFYNARDFLYPDTIEFLQSKEKDNLIILTAMSPVPTRAACEYQKEKLKNARMEEFVDRVVVMEGDKGPYVKELCSGGGAIFVDDRAEHLISAKKLCQDVLCFLMVREGLIRESNENVAKVTSLAELDTMIGV